MRDELGLNVRILARLVALDTEGLERALPVACQMSSKGLSFTERSVEQVATVFTHEEIDVREFGMSRFSEVFVGLTGVIPVFECLVAL